MAKCLFLSSIPFDASAVSAVSEAGTLISKNLQLQEPENKWRSMGTSHRLVVHLPYAIACNAAAFIAHTAAGSATVQVQGGTTLAQVTDAATPAVDVTVDLWPTSGKPSAVDMVGYSGYDSLITWSNDAALSWWSFTIDDSLNTDGYFDMGRFMVDRAVQPKINPTNEIAVQVVTKGEQRRGMFNRIRTEERGPISRRMLLPFDAINAVDMRKKFFNFQMAHGSTKDFFVSADPAAQEDFPMYSMQALFEDTTQFTRQSFFDADGGMWRGSVAVMQFT